ncbi:MAG: hypothetical protein QT04_C0004G0002 [archaeon GW2011_AR11]|nr:MAG: hypothetical protein QT04_C0004G0002 [archaeon GW2011_AR11]
MQYPSFQDIYRSAPFFPASGVFQSFPQLFRVAFDANAMLHPSYQNITKIAKDPIVDGIIIGKACGRYASNQSLFGLALVGIGKERFIAPFYADAKARAGYVDRKIAAKTDIDSFSELGLEGTIASIRKSEEVTFSGIYDTAPVTIPVFAGCFAVGHQLGIVQLVELATGVPGITQAVLFTAGGVAWISHRKHKQVYENNYRQLAQLITSGKEQKQIEQKK